MSADTTADKKHIWRNSMKKSILLFIAAALSLCVAGCGTGSEKAQTGLSEDEARALVLEIFTGVTEEDILLCELNEDDSSLKKYDIKVDCDGIESIISLAADDGTILYAESEPLTSSDGSTVDKEYDAEKIKKIALDQVAGASDIDVHLCIYSNEPGENPYYSVMINYDGKTYAFSIDAKTGEIFYQEILEEIIE